MREAVFLTLAVATFVGFVFAPDGADEPENAAISQAEAERVPGGTGSDPARYAAWAAGSIDLARAADGHFYAETTVNSAPVRRIRAISNPMPAWPIFPVMGQAICGAVPRVNSWSGTSVPS